MNETTSLQDELRYNKDYLNTFENAIGKTISNVELDEKDNILRIYFTDGTKINFWDNDSLCCETRYMRTDDDLSSFVGTKFIGASIKKAPSIIDEREDSGFGIEHDVQFLEIHTSDGMFTMSNHNVHNGYYSGFGIVVDSK